MTQLFISHSSKNNPEALALSQWLTAEGWDEQFLDIDRHFLPLPVIRPERAVLSGSNGLVECLWTLRRERKLNWSRRQIEEAH